MAISLDGKTVFVANYGSGTLTLIDIATGTAGRTFEVGKFPYAIAVIP